MTRTYTASSEEDSMLHLAGKAYGITHSCWRKFLDLLTDGPDLARVGTHGYLSEWDRELLKDYQELISLEPRIVDISARRSARDIAKLLKAGRDALQTSEVHTISHDVPLWDTGKIIPASKRLRGIGDDVCGSLLCPPSHNWNDPVVRGSIRNYGIVFGADDFPCFLWENERADMSDLNKGFLLGGILVLAMVCILLGPSVALNGKGTGAGGYADKFNMQSITVPTIAFAASLARHSLTADTRFSWAGDGSHFNYLKFYSAIIKAVERWPETERTKLIEWWNSRILSQLPGRSHAMSLPSNPQSGSVAAIMHQQALGP